VAKAAHKASAKIVFFIVCSPFAGENARCNPPHRLKFL
jgi:hypothetical protein